ncbi:hypothetical protein O6H91_07G106000 [Diphasiastrum complanatum]|nr:hypothetical protein O6H91_07G106000 [Diphasiastrum complanatum]
MSGLVDQLLETLVEVQNLRDQIVYVINEANAADDVRNQMNSERSDDAQQHINEQNDSQLGSPGTQELHEGEVIDAGEIHGDTEDEASILEELYEMCQRDLANASNQNMGGSQNEEGEVSEAAGFLQSQMNSERNNNAKQNELQLRPPLTETEMIDAYLEGKLRP